jgi:hypothetical protein
MAALLTQPQPGYPGAGVGDDRVGDGVQVTGTGDRVVVESLDAEQATVGARPISRKAGRFTGPFLITKSMLSLIVVSVRRARPSLWYCLIVVCL